MKTTSEPMAIGAPHLSALERQVYAGVANRDEVRGMIFCIEQGGFACPPAATVRRIVSAQLATQAAEVRR